MDVAVCVPYRPRNDHEIAVWSWCERWWRARFPDWVIVAADSGDEPFNRSASRNAAARMTPDATTLVFCNADTIVSDPADLATAVDVCESGGWCLSDTYYETSAEWTAGVLALPPGSRLPDPVATADRRLPNSPAGPQVVSRTAWESVGRWDEGFADGWAYEDAALRDAMDVLHTPHTKVFTTYHLWHARTRAETVHDRGVQKNRQRYFQRYRRAMTQRSPDARRTAMLRAIPPKR